MTIDILKLTILIVGVIVALVTVIVVLIKWFVGSKLSTEVWKERKEANEARHAANTRLIKLFWNQTEKEFKRLWRAINDLRKNGKK